MREMGKYRGKRKDNGEWVYGSLAIGYTESSQFRERGPYIEWFVGEEVYHRSEEVIPETVGESTGLHDNNGKEGYESDKVSFGATRPIYVIKWSICNAGFYLESMDAQKESLHISNVIVGTIIGTIHENPELLSP